MRSLRWKTPYESMGTTAAKLAAIAACREASGTPSGGPEGSRLEVDQGGRIVARMGFQSTGQSHETMVTQIVCDQLGVTPKDVGFERAPGTRGIVGGATTGSRMMLMLGGALHRATGKVKYQVARDCRVCTPS